jgi:transposase
VLRKSAFHLLFILPKSSFGKGKILEGLTKEEIRISKEALFKGVSTRFGLRTIEKYIENLDFIFCSIFQNLRLGSIKSAFHLLFILPKSSFGEHKVAIVECAVGATKLAPTRPGPKLHSYKRTLYGAAHIPQAKDASGATYLTLAHMSGASGGASARARAHLHALATACEFLVVHGRVQL